MNTPFDVSAPALAILAELWMAADGTALTQRSGRIAMTLTEVLNEIEAEMTQIGELTRMENGIGLVLAIQRRASGAVSLRWRTRRNRMLSADALAMRVAGLPPEVGRWYIELDAKVRWLNARERLVRHARQVMRDLSEERNHGLSIEQFNLIGDAR
jgi:hypothetical protein